jgi:PPOX class probable F420-dependent enzyme
MCGKVPAVVDDARAAMRMSDDEVHAFLAGGRRVQVVTLDGGGQIDVVPMSYLFWNERLALWTDPASQKIRNLRRNPHIACLVEAGDQFENFRAVQLRGRAELIEDLQSSRQAGELLFARHGSGSLTDEARSAVAALAPHRVVVVVHPDRMVSWDHRKLGGITPDDVGH